MQILTSLCSYSVFSSDEVRLIHNEEADVLDILSLFPATRQDVPFVRGADDDVAFSQQLQICAGFSRQQNHLLVQDILEFLVPVNKHLRNKNPCLEGSQIFSAFFLNILITLQSQTCIFVAHVKRKKQCIVF